MSSIRRKEVTDPSCSTSSAAVFGGEVDPRVLYTTSSGMRLERSRNVRSAIKLGLLLSGGTWYKSLDQSLDVESDISRHWWQMCETVTGAAR